MKPLKKAHQKNVNVDLDYYNYEGLRDLFYTYHCITVASEYDDQGNYTGCHFVYNWEAYKDGCYKARLAGKLGYDEYLPVHIFIEDQIKELKVICEDGYYYTVAVMNDGGQVYITL